MAASLKWAWLVMIIGGIGIAVILILSTSQRPTSPQESKFLSEKPTEQRLEFEELLTGRSLKPGADYVSFTNYRSRDGIALKRRVETYPSSSKAIQAFESNKKEGSILDEGEIRINEKPERRVVLKWVRSRPNAAFAILWTHGSALWIIESSSLRHALEFERQVYQR